MPAKPKKPNENNPSIDHVVGHTVKALRTQNGLTIRSLADNSGVSEAMISRIESGQVSPSLNTLDALSAALKVPVVNLFRDTAEHADVTFVKAGKGLASRRYSPETNHDFQLLGYHKRQDIRFEPYMITQSLADQEMHNVLSHDHGCEFIYMIEGKMIFRCGDKNYTLEPGDSISFDTMAGRGVEKILTAQVRYLVIFSQRI